MSVRETGLYYLQSRYYNPEWGRFINADAFVATGQGLLGNNMFAYCGNNPVTRKDSAGTAYVFLEEFMTEVDPDGRYDEGGGGGSGFWGGFVQSMNYAANGLSMAMGNKNPSITEHHHIFSNKNKTYSPQFKEIMDRYNMFLDSAENIVELQGHHGRHTNAYHNFMLDSLKSLDTIADGNTSLFYEGFLMIVAFLRENPWLPYAR